MNLGTALFMESIGVCHLVREVNGTEPVKKFIESYVSNPCGVEHELVVVFKGFANEVIPAEYREILEPVEYRPIFLSDRGFDIGSYFEASERMEHQFVCFLNSFSLILSEGWLEKLHQNMLKPQAGLVGATASYESHYANFLSHIEKAKNVRSSNPLRRWVGDYRRQQTLRGIEQHFAPFPNYHIRTNAFMLSRTTMLSLKRGEFNEKIDAERFESGKNGLTRQIYEQGLEALVVGRDGNGYKKGDWPVSRTFRSGSQENLLVGDNRTQHYLEATDMERQQMREQTWGKSKS